MGRVGAYLRKFHFGAKPRLYPLTAVVVLTLLVGALPAARDYFSSPGVAEGHGQYIKTPVIMYSTRWCPYCKKAREYFKRHQFSYIEYDIEASATNLESFRALNGNGVPLILVGERRMQGFTPQSFEALLK
ncbi:MAG: glutaredoxin domain-containing protein [Burkholderiales bacterium]|nr:glutaredoxin domain-containing protein [Burkholderiales bacterium]